MGERTAPPVPPRAIDLTGQTFGRLTVIEYAGSDKKGNAHWRCVCTGPGCNMREVTVYGTSLRSGASRSCGCLKVKHGLTHHPLYPVWNAMIRRCTNPNDAGYPAYGGRGVMVCPEWLESPEAFIRDMGLRPSPGHSIDRIDVDGPYAPWNCRWATREEQDRNLRRNVWIEYRGVRLIAADWARELGISHGTLAKRLQLKWAPEQVLTTGVPPDRVAAVFATHRPAHVTDVAA
jgi:hypothetical protein